jgi:hypothetical protein
MNIFDLLFEYWNNIGILILLYKLPILAQNLKNTLSASAISHHCKSWGKSFLLAVLFKSDSR